MYKATRLLLLAILVLVTNCLSLFAQTDDTEYRVRLASIAFVQIELDDDCTREVIYQNVLSGNADEDGDGQRPPEEAFLITVFDDDTSNGPVIDGCGTFRYEVEPNPDFMIVGFTFGSGEITAIDTDEPEQVGIATALAGPFLTPQLDELTINSLNQSVPRTYTTDGTTGQPVTGGPVDSLLARIMAGGTVAAFTDGCSDVTVEVRDRVVTNGPCEAIVIVRTFTATDQSGACATGPGIEQMQTVVTYEIFLSRPDVADVQAPPDVVNFECNDPDVQPGELPNPRPMDYPFIDTPDGPVFIEGTYGNVGVSFTNGAPIVTCENTFKFLRTYTVIDWCNTDDVRTFNQLVKVGDTTPPGIMKPLPDNDGDGKPDEGPIVFGTNAPGCGAILSTQMTGLAVRDACSNNVTLQAFILIDRDPGNVAGPIDPNAPNPVDRLTPFLPLGPHIMRYVATDECGNETVLDLDIVIVDDSGPVVIAEDALNVSLSDNGFAVVLATDVDEASYDDCSEITLDIAFADPNTMLPIGTFAPSITLTCIDVGVVPVILRATDADGNINTRLSFLNVVDNVAPLCIAPGNLTISCDDAAATIPEDLADAMATNPDGMITTLNAAFGTPTSLDNCGDELVTQTVDVDINDCGTGTVTRNFLVTDGQGFASTSDCAQTVTVRGFRDYTVTFPADASTTCGDGITFDDVSADATGCDMIVSTTIVDTFFTTSTACYKIRRTIEVINWCEYDGDSDFYVVPRDADGDDTADTPTVLHVVSNSNTDPDDDVALLDRDTDRDNDNTLGFLDPDDDPDVIGDADLDGDTGYGDSESRGAFRYVQFIKVVDEEAPVIFDVVVNPTPGQNCGGGGADLMFRVSDACAGTDLQPTVEIDLDYTLGGSFNPTRTLTPAELTTTGGGVFMAVLTELPAGQHAFRMRVSDGCGNRNLRVEPFKVENRTALSLICAGRLNTILMNDPNGGATGLVEADDYVIDVTGNCTNSGLRYAVYRIEGETDQPGFVPSPNRASFTVSCEDVGEIPVRVYVFTDNGDFSVCNGVANVVAGDSVDCAPPGVGSLAGFVFSPSNELLNDVPIRIHDQEAMDAMMYTDDNGSFLFTGLSEGGTYTVAPETESSVNIRSVRTSDIMAIIQHILGAEEFRNPYQLIAADVNADGYVDIFDLIDIRSVILGETNEFPNGPAWRYVRRDFDLTGLTEGWDPDFLPGSFTVGPLDGHNREADFVAIEMGDVFSRPGGREPAGLMLTDQTLAAGERTTVTLTAAEGLTALQGTLSAASGLVIEGWRSDYLTAGHVNDRQLDAGRLAFSYAFEAAEALTDRSLLTLDLYAATEVRLSDYLSVDDRVTYPEAVLAGGRTTDLHLVFNSVTGSKALTLYQNYPNPVTLQTTVAFDLPAPADATLRVHDAAGRLLHQRNVPARAGRNAVTLTRGDLRQTTGLLTYSLTVGKRSLTKRMMVVAR